MEDTFRYVDRFCSRGEALGPCLKRSLKLLFKNFPMGSKIVIAAIDMIESFLSDSVLKSIHLDTAGPNS